MATQEYWDRQASAVLARRAAGQDWEEAGRRLVERFAAVELCDVEGAPFYRGVLGKLRRLLESVEADQRSRHPE